MDPIIKINRERWNALVDANVMHSIPFLEFTREDAAKIVYQFDGIPDVSGKRVLCLAAGGGQESAAFGLLGAVVTVFDLSDNQLERDREAAAHHGYQVETIQEDMRDLSVFGDNSFDIVWHAYSINYVPNIESVIREASRVLKSEGIYNLNFANPFALALDSYWDGKGYPLRGKCTDGEDISYYYPICDVEQSDGTIISVPRPHEYRHNLSTVLNTVAQNGFLLLSFNEWMREADDPEIGSWPHFTQCAHLYFGSYWRRR